MMHDLSHLCAIKLISLKETKDTLKMRGFIELPINSSNLSS